MVDDDDDDTAAKKQGPSYYLSFARPLYAYLRDVLLPSLHPSLYSECARCPFRYSSFFLFILFYFFD
jgi:hypothetical protein